MTVYNSGTNTKVIPCPNFDIVGAFNFFDQRSSRTQQSIQVCPKFISSNLKDTDNTMVLGWDFSNNAYTVMSEFQVNSSTQITIGSTGNGGYISGTLIFYKFT